MEDGRFVHEQAVAFVVIQPQHLVGEVADQQVRPAGAVVVGGVHAHGAARHAVFAERHAGRHAFFGERAVAVVAVQLVGLRIVGDEQIRPAVAVVIEHRDAQRLAGGIADAGLLGHILELAVAQIVIQLRRRALVGFRRAVRLGRAVERAPQIALGGPLHVVGDEQVQLAVAVVIEPGGAGAEVGVVDAGRRW